MVGCVTTFALGSYFFFCHLNICLGFCYATACNLINNDMKQFIISSETDTIREAEERVIILLLEHLQGGVLPIGGALNSLSCAENNQFTYFLFINLFDIRVIKLRLLVLSKKK